MGESSALDIYILSVLCGVFKLESSDWLVCVFLAACVESIDWCVQASCWMFVSKMIGQKWFCGLVFSG